MSISPSRPPSSHSRICEAVKRFHRDVLGRGPASARCHSFEDMVVVRCSGVLSPTEIRLAADGGEGIELIHRCRRKLVEAAGDELASRIAAVLQRPVRGFCIDVCAPLDEGVFVFFLDGLQEPLERGPQSQETS